jgi:hypothetical protein
VHKVTRYSALAVWLCLLAAFVSLRFDNTDRLYFYLDDDIVVWQVDHIIESRQWQPDWFLVSHKQMTTPFFINEQLRTNLPHPHHYNFTGHILSAAVAVKAMRGLGITTPTITLLHHIAFFWDSLCLLFIVLTARRLGGQSLATVSALLYTFFPLAVQGSHYARPDALLSCMGAILLYAGVNVRHWKKTLWIATNALAMALAITTKASQLMLGIVPALAASGDFLLDPQQRQWRTLWRIVIDGMAIVLIIWLLMACTFAATNITFKDFALSMLSAKVYYDFPGPPDALEHYSYSTQLLNILDYFRSALGWPLLLVIPAGVIALTRNADRFPLLLLTAPLVLFLAYFASVPAFFDRSFCPLASNIILLAAVGITHFTSNYGKNDASKLVLVIVVTLLAAYKPLIISYHLQTDHLRSHHNDDRLSYQQQLKKETTEKTGVDYWIKNVDRSDLFSQTLPEKPPKNPRIYMVEDLNDYNSRDYLKKLRNNGFVQIGEFQGDFADMPTNSLITVHEAARFVYFIRQDGQ